MEFLYDVLIFGIIFLPALALEEYYYRKDLEKLKRDNAADLDKRKKEMIEAAGKIQKWFDNFYKQKGE
jgi:hypothetical protein